MYFHKQKIARCWAYTLIFASLLLLPIIIFSYTDANITSHKPLWLLMFICLFVAFCILKFIPFETTLTKGRNAYMCILIIVITIVLIGAFPYAILDERFNFINAILESTAGITTTTASTIGESSLCHTLLLWKGLQHWMGGLLALMLFIAVLPYLGSGDQQVSIAETHGSYINKFAPKFHTILLKITLIYGILTILALLYFMLCRLPIFDSVLLSFSTSSTSFINIHNTGLAYYNSSAVEIGMSVFSLLSAISFITYMNILNKKFREITKNFELKTFIIILFVATTIISIILSYRHVGTSIINNIKDAFVQVASFASTGGFASVDYNLWPSSCTFILLSLMIIGGCSSSTTGSFKVIRLLITLKLISRGVTRRLHPNSVRAIRLGDSTLSAKMISSVSSFSLLYLVTILVSMVILSLQDIGLLNVFAATFGCISNNGISFADVGMTGYYGMFAWPSQLFLSFLMISGKLGILSVFVVFLPSFWNPNRHTHNK